MSAGDGGEGFGTLAVPLSLRKQWRRALTEQALLMDTQTARRPLANESAALPVPPIGGAVAAGLGRGQRAPGSAAGCDPRSAGSRRAVPVPCGNGVT